MSTEIRPGSEWVDTKPLTIPVRVTAATPPGGEARRRLRVITTHGDWVTAESTWEIREAGGDWQPVAARRMYTDTGPFLTGRHQPLEGS